MNNSVMHPRNGDFVKGRPDLFSDYSCIYPENEQLPKTLCFRNVSEYSSRVSSKNLIANSRNFSYTKNTPLRATYFRKDTNPIPYKENSLIREPFENSTRLAFVMKYPIKGIEAVINLNNVTRSKGVQS